MWWLMFLGGVEVGRFCFCTGYESQEFEVNALSQLEKFLKVKSTPRCETGM